MARNILYGFDGSTYVRTVRMLLAESLFESVISVGYAAIAVYIIAAVEVRNRKAPVWYLPNARRHESQALIPPGLSRQPIGIPYSNRL